ncbi:MAG TPA: YceI family protein [Thermoanaerobaculia bacterium]|nr:YceI family protein [Thermoanaerobaculia bacterium]
MRLTIAAVLLAAATTLHADSRSYTIAKGGNNVAEFHAEDTYDSFDGKTTDVIGTIVADPANPSAASVQIAINVDALDTGNGLRNKEMRERYLETARFGTATFKSVSVSGPASIAANQPADMSVTGDLTLHGVTKRMTIPVRVVLLPDGRIHATTSFKVRMPDFGINVPHNILVTVNDEVPVRLDVWAVGK